MLFGIISDIHGNLEALEVVLKELKNVDKIICLGDIVGYCANPNECVERISSLNCISICGNHDLASIGIYDIKFFNPAASEAILWTQRNLREENKKFLKNLEEVKVIGDFTIVHGSLIDPPTSYITSPYEARLCFEHLRTDICFIGHTHISEFYIKREEEVSVYNFPLFDGGRLNIKDGISYIINCGSVGQPRDGNPKASFGIYDRDKRIVEVRKIDYSLEVTQRKIEENGLPVILSERLKFGR